MVLNTPESSSGPTVQLGLTMAGGHAVAHAPLQVLLASTSLVKPYSVMPSWPTRILPSGDVAALTTTSSPALVGPADVVASVTGAAAGAASSPPQAARPRLRAAAASSPGMSRLVYMGLLLDLAGA